MYSSIPESNLYKKTLLQDDYTLKYLTWHLIEAGQDDKLYKILLDSPDWLNAKAEKFKGDISYLSDINLALETINKIENFKILFHFIALHSARTVVYHRMSQYNYNSLQALVWIDNEDEALNHTRQRPKLLSGKKLSDSKTLLRGATTPEGEKLLGFFRIYEALYDKYKRRTTNIIELERDIVNNITSLTDDDDYYGAVEEFVEVLIRFNQTELAEYLINYRKIDRSYNSTRELLLNLYLKTYQFDKAKKLIAKEIKFNKDGHYEDLATAYIEAGRIPEAELIIKKISFKYYRERISLKLLVSCAETNNLKKLNSLLKIYPSLTLAREMCHLARFYHNNNIELEEWVIKRIEYIIDLIPALGPHHDDVSAEELRSYALTSLASLYVDIDKLELASQALNKAEYYISKVYHGYSWQQATKSFLTNLVNLGFYERAYQSVIQYESWYIVQVVAQLAYNKQFDLAIKLANQIPASHNKVEALYAITIYLGKNDLVDLAKEKYKEAYSILKKLPDYNNYYDIACDICRALFYLNDNRSLEIIKLVYQTLVNELALDKEEFLNIKKNQPGSGNYYHINSSLENALRRVTIELLRHSEYKYAYELSILNMSYCVNCRAKEKDINEIINNLYEAKKYLSKSELIEITRLLHIGDLNGLLYIEIIDNENLSSDFRLNKLSEMYDRKQNSSEEINTIIYYLIIEYLKIDDIDKAKIYVYKLKGESYANSFFELSIRELVKKILSKRQEEKIRKFINEFYDNKAFLQSIYLELIAYYLENNLSKEAEIILIDENDPRLYLQAIKTLGLLKKIDQAEIYFQKLKDSSSSYTRNELFFEALLVLIKLSFNANSHFQAQNYISEAKLLISGKDSYLPSEHIESLVKIMLENGHFVEVYNDLEFMGEENLLRYILRSESSLKDDPNLFISILEKVLFIYSWEFNEWESISNILTPKLYNDVNKEFV